MASSASATVLVTGASGLLGRQMMAAFNLAGSFFVLGQGLTRATPPTVLQADLAQPEQIERLLDESRAGIIIHCAAIRSPDQCAHDPERARRINVEATRHLAQQAAERGAWLIYISTDYVFSGQPGEAPYETDAEPRPTNLYGQLKREGELAVLDTPGAGVVLRVPLLYGHAVRNDESAVNVLVDAVWKQQQQQQQPPPQIQMDDWAQRYPTNTEDVARVCCDLVGRHLRGLSVPRILHFSSEDRMTKYEMCQKLAHVLGLPLTGMAPNRQGNEGSSVQRPYDCHLSTVQLQQLGISVATVDFEAWWRRELKAFRR